MKLACLPKGNKSLFFPSLPEAATAPLVANFMSQNDYGVVILVADSISKAELWGEDVAGLISFLKPEKKTSLSLFDEYPEIASPDSFDRNCDRISVLSKLLSSGDKNPRKECLLVATTPQALISPCPQIDKYMKGEIVIRTGMNLPFKSFCETLGNELDYSSEILCEEPGQFSIRGGLVDVFPVNHNNPVRIDFFGDEVEDLRIFDPNTQRSTRKENQVVISSLSKRDEHGIEGEFFKYPTVPVLWYLREPEKMALQQPLAFHESTREAMKKANFSMAWKEATCHKSFFLGSSELDNGFGIFKNSKKKTLKILSNLDEIEGKTTNFLVERNFENEKRNRVSALFKLLERQDLGNKIFISTGADSEKKRILDLISEESALSRLNPVFVPVGLKDGIRVPPNQKEDFFSEFSGNRGGGFSLAASREILGWERSRTSMISRKARVNRKQVDQALDFSEIIEGDYLVHHQHGICRFESMGRIGGNDQDEEAITLEFDSGLLLHVPLQESHLLSRYVGLSKTKPKLAKLGGKSWVKTKQAAEEAVIDLAADLLRLQATRSSKIGYSFSPDEHWQKEFEDSFPHTETPDQQRAITQVKEDMEKEEPMDRLICGDVGFGKTEVALRAAFKAVMDGKQVALLAPTTILTQQHLNSFRQRMADFPIAIEMLSRFRSASQQQKILRATHAGSIDILIGTHRLLSTDVLFKDLGLLIVDEEQRFGVKHKEVIKKMKADVDVLTLSATPIPRTLYFAMVGAKSLSLIETAPINRRPIRTEVIHNSNQVLKKAIDLETRRGGQVFYLHNRVKTIHSVARKLQSLFPKLRIALGHGQMNEEELEQVMTDFVAGNYDLLVCTTIIESGLDIPNCNTIIIEGADKFGLSQLYQLRGRVGRFNRQAYAYLLLNRHLPISSDARKRLSSIRQINNFGAGFRIALRDLELRGSGNLLGSEQSGHIAGIGFEMYCRLLKESVSRLKGDLVSLRPSATVRLDFLQPRRDCGNSTENNGIRSCLPEEYASEPRLRIEGYRKLAQMKEISEIDHFKDELIDRFGKVPEETEALLMETKLRCLCEEAGFDLLEVKGKEIFLRFLKKPSEKKVRYLRKMGAFPRLSSNAPLLKLKELIRFLKIYVHGK